MEAEYGAQAHAVYEVLWIENMRMELNVVYPTKCFAIDCENSNAISLTQDNFMPAKSKNIVFVFHFASDYVKKGILCLNYIPTAKMAAMGLRSH